MHGIDKCSINSSYYPYVTDGELRLDTCSQAHSWLEAERGSELRLSCSRAHAQPPGKQ